MHGYLQLQKTRHHALRGPRQPMLLLLAQVYLKIQLCFPKDILQTAFAYTLLLTGSVFGTQMRSKFIGFVLGASHYQTEVSRPAVSVIFTAEVYNW